MNVDLNRNYHSINSSSVGSVLCNWTGVHLSTAAVALWASQLNCYDFLLSGKFIIVVSTGAWIQPGLSELGVYSVL